VKSSISEITTVAASFAEDVDAYRAAGVDAIGIWEMKLGDDVADRERVRESGLAVSHCVPGVPSILPLPLMAGPVDPEQRVEATIVSTLDDAAALLDEAGASTAGLMFDTWHLWNDDGLMEAIERHVGRIAGVHVADWREPTRNTNDRVFPGDGTAPLPAILGALDRAGYEGFYDVEIFSDTGLDGSLWTLEPVDAARRASEKLKQVWAKRGR
jgi:sugar phosphate isomerase/epimerase